MTVETAGRLQDGRRDWPLWSEAYAEESPSEFTDGLARDSVELLRVGQGRAGGSPGCGTPQLAVRPRRASLRGRTPPAVSPR
ncbi:hypothetical protein [Streptomyces flaveolus]|uniref:hypothetical protein n=1 Tax=Streptomyces flaveolus TaxID=67297 RepID=UPI003F540635